MHSRLSVLAGAVSSIGIVLISILVVTDIGEWLSLGAYLPMLVRAVWAVGMVLAVGGLGIFAIGKLAQAGSGGMR